MRENCGLDKDNARHTLLECRKWNVKRAKFKYALRTLKLGEIVERMISFPKILQSIARFEVKVMYQRGI